MAISKSGGSLESAIIGGLSQQSRPFRVKTSLSEDHLVFRSMRITETLSEPFEMEIEVVSDDPSIEYDRVLGHNLTVGVYRPQGDERFFNGYITAFGFAGVRGRQYAYKATVSPWLWLLTQTMNSRIFHNKSAIDIAETIFGEHTFGDFRIEGSINAPEYDYCVQYQESDFNFISRLFEKEGIYYFFEHENGRHVMVITNSMDGHASDDGYETIPMTPADSSAHQFRESISSLRNRQQIRPTKVTLQDYNYVMPRAEMNATDTIARGHAASGMQLYQYPGEYKDADAGSQYAKLRVEEQQADFDTVQAETNARGIRTGYKFELSGHSIDRLNTDYLVTSSYTECRGGEYASGGVATDDLYTCRFSAMPMRGIFRPARTARQPKIYGPQTAVVANRTEGEEIEPVDKYGCVTVLFAWEREGVLSCPVRVSQVWAGAHWGSMMIPRHGQEVIVEFEEGNPNRPIITGRVYNDKSEPPYDPLERPTVTTFKTNSSKGGGGYNELRFDDKKGEENVFIHSEKTMDVRIKDTKLQYIGKDHHEIVEENQFLEIRQDKHETVGGGLRLAVTDDISIIGDGDIHQVAGSNIAIDAGQSVHLKAGSMAVIEASSGISLKCGGNFITINSAGVSIKGTMVNINSGGAALSGPGEGAQSPELPEEALDDQAGEISPPPRGRSYQPTATELSSHPVAAMLLQAAEAASVICPLCAELARQRAAGGGTV